MPLSWNEIRERATRFSKEWDGVTSERADAQTFWNEFFEVFGVTRKRVAVYEKQVELTRGKGKTKMGRIDAFWKGTLLVEHKSAGEDLDKAFVQASDYFAGIKERDLPRYIVVSNFDRLRLYDLEADKEWDFKVSKFRDHVGLFGFIAGYETHKIEEKEEAANIKAAEQLGKLHDLLERSGYKGHQLEVLLVRLLFCLFADDTGIFDKNQFREYLDVKTAEDGSDLGMHLGKLFEVLNTEPVKRSTKLDEQLAAFRYVNGRLFDEVLPLADFDSAMREALLDASALDWSAISPAIFGSLFQSIRDRVARRNLGAHYTREVNILKALRPLFLDDLQAELTEIGTNSKRLLEFQKKLAAIRILDPACGCGNFLVIAYRELRLMELEVLHRLHQRGKSTRVMDVKALVFVDVDQFYGIEIEDFPAQIAQVALWLTDHQMNMKVSDEFGEYFARLPLKKSPNIVRDNALRIQWESVVDPQNLSYIVGNPPFVGKAYQTPEQKEEIDALFKGVKGAGVLDYVACWYRKATAYIAANATIRVAFVSTNSITQGEQVGVLWPNLMERGLHIHFAHRTFQWTSEARGRAAVHCVIIGFSLMEATDHWLFDYETIRAEPQRIKVSNINAYLVDAANVFLSKRRDPICTNEPEMAFGSMPNDGGNLLLDPEEKAELLKRAPAAAPLLRRLMGSEEYINGLERWCLWLVDADPKLVRSLAPVMERVEKVKKQRRESPRETTKKLADTPTIFGEIRQPKRKFLAFPEVSSESRRFIPIGFLDSSVVATNKLYTIDGATLYHFGILTSSMHMAWVRAVCGRLKSDYQYSAGIVYNNFPWPDATEEKRRAVEEAASAVLETRKRFASSTLADLYDPIAMPPELLKAHDKLDKAVDAAYGKKEFKTEAERVSFLFGLYEKLVKPPELDLAMPAPAKAPKRKRASKAA